jgi:aryl-alcohol dehydrogenase-like predicted oxidoreductase
MERRPLGRSGLSVAPLAFGGNVFGWTADESTSFRLLDTFVDAGFNLIDTADSYSAWAPGHSGGESEAILGRWLRSRGRRDDVVVATKVGMEMGSGAMGLGRSHIASSIAASLARLQTDHVDLYQSHVDDAGTPIEETLEAHAKLVAEGKVRAIGASNFSPERLTESLSVSRSHGWPRYECVQPKYNLVDRDVFEGPLERTCRAESLGVLPHSSLAKGFLSWKYRTPADFRSSARGPAVERLATERGRRVLAAVVAVAERLDFPPSTVAIAWVAGRPSVTAAIASATTVEQLTELMEGATLKLDATSRAELDAAGGPAVPG